MTNENDFITRYNVVCLEIIVLIANFDNYRDSMPWCNSEENEGGNQRSREERRV